MSHNELVANPPIRWIFGRDKALIGMIPQPPLPGYPEHPGLPAVVEAALADLAALEAAGFDGALIENDNDQPHTIGATPAVQAAMDAVVRTVVAEARIPVGMEIIYDMEATVIIAARTEAAFVRLDVFVDAVETRWGVVPASAARIAELRQELGADDLLLFTDVHVKHAKLLEAKSLAQSVAESISAGSDGVIITGDWTGNPPTVTDLLTAREASGGIPVIIGSGLTAANAPELMPFADAAIVGTALKTNGRIDPAKAAALAAAVAPLRTGA